MSRRHGVNVTGEMEVDLFHRNNLCVSAACRAALHAEARPQRRLTKRHNGLFAYLVKSEREAYRDSGLADSRFCRSDGCNQYKLAFCYFFRVDQRERNLGHVVTILCYVLFGNTYAFSNFGNSAHLDASCNFDIRLHIFLNFL